MNITFEQTKAALQTKLGERLEILKRQSEETRLSLYMFQNEWGKLVLEHACIPDEEKRITLGLKELFKSRTCKFSVRSMVNKVYNHPPCPPDFESELKEKNPRLNQLVYLIIEVENDDYMGSSGKRKMDFSYAIYPIISLIAQRKQTLIDWKSAHNKYNEIEKEMGKLSKINLNINNEAQLLLLELTDKESYLALVKAVENKLGIK